MRLLTLIVIGACVCLALPHPGHAGIAGTTPNMTVIAPPASVVLHALEDNSKIFVFSEKQGVKLAASLLADVVAPGTYSLPAQLTGGSIAAGTYVDSYFLHIDPVGDSPSTLYKYYGSVTFDTPILGVFVLDGTVAGTDTLLGNPGTTYPGLVTNRGLELNGQDKFTLSGDMKTLNVDLFQAANVMDHVRIVTAAPIPEPVFFQFGAMMGLSGLGVLRLRRKA